MQGNPFFWGKAGQKLSPEDVERRREYAKAAGERGVDTSPVGHWSQGAARVIDSLGGVFADRRANKSEEAGMSGADDYIANNPVLASLIGQGGGGIGVGVPAGVPVPMSEEEQLGDAAMSAIGKPPVSGGGVNAAEIRQGLIARGLPEHVADGFIMNFQDESGLNPGINEANPIVPGSRGGYGLYQLTGPRRVAYEQFAADRGVAPDDVDAQLDFLMHELQGPEAAAAQSILGSQDSGQAAAAIVNKFLRPAEQHRASREARYTGGQGGGSMGGSFTGGNTQMADNSGVVAALAGAMSDPWVAKKYGPAIQALMGQQMKRGDADYAQQLRQNDPMYQAQLAKLNAPEAVDPFAGTQVINGQVVRMGEGGMPESIGNFNTPDPGYEMVSPEEVSALGLPEGAYQRGADGKISQVGKSGVTVNVGDGSPGLGKLSSDYGYVLDPNTGQPVIDPNTGLPTAAPVPGSPAARDIEQSGIKAEGAQAQKARAGATVVQDLQRGLDLIPELGMLGSEGGVIGGISRTTSAKIPGTIANRITQFTESALSNVGLDTLQNMRENSPTGGALGQVPIQQQQRLEQVLGSLNINQPPEVLEANIKRVMNIYTDIIYGDAAERQRAVADGRMSPEQSAEIDGYHYELPFDERGRPITKSDGTGGISQTTAPQFLSQQDTENWDYYDDDQKAAILRTYPEAQQ